MSKYRLLIWKRRERKIRKLLRMSDKKLGRKAKRRMRILNWISSYNEIAYIILVSTLIIVALLSLIIAILYDSWIFLISTILPIVIDFLFLMWMDSSGKDDVLFMSLPKPLDILAKTLDQDKSADIRHITYNSPFTSYLTCDYPECWTDEEYGRAIKAILSWADIYAEMRGDVTDDVKDTFRNSMIMKQFEDTVKKPKERLNRELSAEKKREEEQLAADKRKEKELKISNSDRALSRIEQLSSMFNDDENMPKWVKNTNEIKRLKGLNDELGKNMTTLQSTLSNDERTVQ